MQNPFRKKIKELATIPVDYKPNVYTAGDATRLLTEQFKGEVQQNKIKFPTDLGEEHPFDFDQMEKLYKKFGFFTAVIDKYIDFIVGPGFYIECDDERAKKIIEDFMRDVNFDTILRAWAKEMLIKGSGFLEIGGDGEKGVEGLKVLSANNMYVDRNKLGQIEGYNQYKGGFKNFNMDRLISEDKVTHFEPKQIAYAPFNVVGDCTYGLGIGYPAMSLIDNWLSMNANEHMIMYRKANAPLHAQFGYMSDNKQVIPKPEDVQALGQDIEIMHNKTDWVTDPLVNFKVIDFPNFGEKFALTKEGDLNMLIYAFQVPAVLLGMANINQGIAKVELEAFQRRIQSMQAELEKIIEQQIFKRVLLANGFDVDVEFEWGTPSILEVEGRVTVLTELIKSPTTSPAMRMMLEDELILLLKLDEDEWEKLKLEQEAKEEEERKRLEAQPIPIVPGQNKGFPPKPVPKAQQPAQPKPQVVRQSEDEFKKIEEARLRELKAIMNNMKEEIDKNNQKNAETFKLIMSNELKEIKDEMKDKAGIQEEELHRIQNTLAQLEKTKKLKRKSNLIPVFNKEVEKKDVDKPKKKLVVKVKRKKKDKNYEYEKICPHCTEKVSDMNDIEEWIGFNYTKYLGEIIKVLAIYEFANIKAVNEIELQAGMLTASQVTELRKILDNGFRKGLGMKEMAIQVNKKVALKDLYRMTPTGDIKVGASGLPILARSADKRAISIVRSEVTRMANAGAVEFYKKNGIQQVSWVSSLSDRTCPECEALNGKIYEINKHPDIPLHPMCRCTLTPVVELK